MTRATVSFDFDDTLMFSDGSPIKSNILLLKSFYKSGFRIIIVTSRNIEHETHEYDKDRVLVTDFLNTHLRGVVERVFYLNHESKLPTLQKENVVCHYDNDSDIVFECNSNKLPSFDVSVTKEQDDRIIRSSIELESDISTSCLRLGVLFTIRMGMHLLNIGMHVRLITDGDMKKIRDWDSTLSRLEQVILLLVNGD